MASTTRKENVSTICISGCACTTCYGNIATLSRSGATRTPCYGNRTTYTSCPRHATVQWDRTSSISTCAGCTTRELNFTTLGGILPVYSQGRIVGFDRVNFYIFSESLDECQSIGTDIRASRVHPYRVSIHIPEQDRDRLTQDHICVIVEVNSTSPSPRSRNV